MRWSCQIFWMLRAAMSGPHPGWQVTMILDGFLRLPCGLRQCDGSEKHGGLTHTTWSSSTP